MGTWDLLLPESALKELMLDKLLNRYLMITLCSQTLHSNAVQACRKVLIITFIILMWNVGIFGSVDLILIRSWLFLLIDLT